MVACGSGDSGSTEPLPDPVCIDETAEQADEFVGLAEGEATDLAATLNLDVREVGRDGECAMVTMDLRTDRVNLEYVEDIVVGAAIY